MLFESDNHYAEQLLRAVGAHAGVVGTEVTGAAVERSVFHQLGAPADGLRVSTAAGSHPRIASRRSRWQRCSRGRTWCRPATSSFTLCARVGIEGTVRRHDLTTALGRARAKSGHINDVDALAGYVDTHHHGRVAFAILVNDPRADDGPVYDGIDAALDILASF